MLRLTISALRESVLVIAQTRDRNGHAANPSDVTDSVTYGVTPALGRAAQPVDSIGQYPYFDLDRDGTFDAVAFENDVVGTPSLPGFYEYTQEMASGRAEVSLPALDPNDATQTLWMYFGREFFFRSIFLKLATPGVYDSAVLDVQYWNGSDWQDVTGRVDGSRLDSLLGLPDQISWERPEDWFPSTIENQLVTSEGSRLVVRRELLWIRVRLSSIVSFTSLPVLSGAWEGEPDSETTSALWLNVERPEKAVILRGSMIRDPNAHLALSLVASRKQPAEISAGTFDFGRGDHYCQIPVYSTETSVLGKDPGAVEYRCTGVNKNGTSVTIPIAASGMIVRPGRYRVRVYGEVPNLDASVFAGESGHQEFVPDPALYNPADPESQFDPTWNPILTAMAANFDVRSKNAFANVEIQRLASGVDSYSLWLDEDRVRALLANQGTKDYARLIVQDAATAAVIIDTMVTGLRDGTAGPLTAQAGSGGVNMDTFRYTESDSGRKLADRGQYHLTVMIVRGEEAFVSRVEVNFFA